MAVQGIIGSAFTFSILFVDEDNEPLAVNDPLITIFTLAAGVKSTLVDGAAMSSVTPAETGRYIYAYTIPSSLADGSVVYGEMEGTDPASGVRLVSELIVNVITLAGAGGLTAQFVKGG